MPSSRVAALFLSSPLLFVSPLVLTACSSSSEEDDSPSDAGPDSATPDMGTAPDSATPDAGATPDASATPDANPDAACVLAVPVWAATDIAFIESDLGGFAPQPPADAGCTTTGTTYAFVVAAKTLRGQSCSFAGFVDKTVTLSAAQLQTVLSAVQALRGDCPPSDRCGADFGTQTLSILHAAASMAAYKGDFYAGCSGQTATGGYIAYTDLIDFEQTLRAIVFPEDAGGN